MVLGGLNTRQILERAGYHIENARQTKDPKIAEVLFYDAESALTHAKRASKWAPKYSEDQNLRNAIAAAYFRLSEIQRHWGHDDNAQTNFRMAEKWGWCGQFQEPSVRTFDTDGDVQSVHGTLASLNAISSGLEPISSSLPTPASKFRFPEPSESLNDILQLVHCLHLLQNSQPLDDTLDSDAMKWLQETRKHPGEQARLEKLAKDVIKEFTRDELKDAETVAEVAYLAPVLQRDDFLRLIRKFCEGIDQPGPLDYHQLEGLAQVIRSSSDYFEANDLVSILKLLDTRLKETHQQSTDRVVLLTLAVSNVLDAMVDAKVEGLDREALHEPLSSYLEELQKSKDPYLIYQAAYAAQALMYVPDNETPWQGALRRTGKVLQGAAELVSATKGLDLKKFIDGLEKIQKGVSGLPKAIKLTKDAYSCVASLSNSGQNFLGCLKESFSFQRKRAWYPTLRKVDTMLQEAQFDEFKRFVEDVPCRHDPAFQWGICQRLGEIADNSSLDLCARLDAIKLLGEIYQNDEKWGQYVNIKQWIVNILMRLAAQPSSVVESVETLFQTLETNGDFKKQALLQACRKEGVSRHPLTIALPRPVYSSLLYHAQNRPEVENGLNWLREQRRKGRGNTLYIQPQAKASLQTSDIECFPLMEKVKKFLDSDQKVFLILGDSGAGKSTFHRELEHELWQEYRESSRIPLHISLPAIDKPEHDMISKQLRKAGFTEPQIRELKLHRRFVLICDGYDESQQTHNLYTSNRLNQPGEWRVHMVISCRSEYLGVDYRDRFQPADRNRQVESAEPVGFQEAILTPFSEGQIKEYINQFVHAHVQLWKEKDYQEALDRIPGLKELVKNPFMLTLALDVLPRMVDPEENLSSARITRVALYDQFVEHWLERGKNRIRGRALSPQEKVTFDSLADEGFTQNGISFLKRLAVAIYKEQDGQPVVEYLRFKDQESWKAAFFGSEEEKQLLREACPLIRNGRQHRFIHRSLLEYGLARAVFDPHEKRRQTASVAARNRRGSASSVLSFEVQDFSKGMGPGGGVQDPHGFESPLVSRSFVKELSLMQFLQELVQQEPDFRQQLLSYIEYSKKDKKWRIAAANAITLLVRAGVQFNGMDLLCSNQPST
ncbi:hypothetical protein BGX34_010920, partial [Mortierella sp. NVP85]